MFYKLYSLLVRINDLFITKTNVEFEKEYDFGNFFIMDKHLENYFVKSGFSADYIIDGLRKKPPL